MLCDGLQVLKTLLDGQPPSDDVNNQSWTFIDAQVTGIYGRVLLEVFLSIYLSQTPQQDNGNDCGVFTCCSMLTEALNLNHTWVPSKMKQVRDHILLQLFRQTIMLPEYNLQP